MANPGYPMQPMQPMQPMGGPPMGMRPPQRMPVRQGTPKAVPIIVSAGLAVGVFCGLLFGLGTGEEEAKADTPKEKQFVGTKIDGTDEVASADPVGPAPPKSVTDGKMVTGTMKEPKGSAAPASGSGSAAPTVVVPTIKMAKLTVTVKPDSVKDAKITVDGAEAKDGVIEIALGDQAKKEVKIVIKAPGYRELEQKLEVNEGETKAEYPRQKRRSSSGTSTPKRPDLPGGSGKKKKGGGSLIDI